MSEQISANCTNSTPSIKSPSSPFIMYYPYLVFEMSLSIICLLLLIWVYVQLREHKTVPGKIVLSVSCCLIVSYTILIIDFMFRDIVSKNSCLIMAVTVHFTFLATFFWTNVMAFDIMKTMSSMKQELGKSTRYWKYGLYAWTSTTLCAAPAYVLDFVTLIPEQYRPRFGQKRCWLNEIPAFLIYFNGPVGIILVSNCILFIITAVKIMTVKNAIARLQTKPHRRRFRLYVKLILVMGLVWITEFIPWLTGIYKLYALAGFLNCLHGVYMFVIFACKARIYKQLKDNLISRFQRSDNKKVTQMQSPSLDTLTTIVSATSVTSLEEKH